MRLPIRLAAALAPGRSTAVLLALAYATIPFIATPFLIPAIGERYEIGLTASSLIGVFQLAGFAVGSFTSGRLLAPTRAVLLSALGVAAASNVVSALLPALPLMLASRALCGLALGAISWFAWSNAFGKTQSMSMAKVAIVGPMIGVVATPAIAVLIDQSGLRSLFLVLALLPLVPLLFARTVPAAVAKPAVTERHAAVPTARILLVALTLFSLGGSAIFQFGVTIAATELGLNANVTALAYTANAVISIPSAGWKGRRTRPSPWMAMTATAGFLVATAISTPLFFVGVVAWGFCYWMSIPGVFSVLSLASAYPEERAGDAQAFMAVGRLIGPLLGGLLLDGSGTSALAAVGCGLMLAAAAAVFTVRNYVGESDTAGST